MLETIAFSEIELRVGANQPGVYEIHTKSGVPLKVGIAGDLRKRLLQHRASRQSALKLKVGGDWSRPGDVRSKQSMLAKHLYYDRELTSEYDLRCEEGRCGYLEACCVIHIQPTETRERARVLERSREATGGFRYVGRVKVRGPGESRRCGY